MLMKSLLLFDTVNIYMQLNINNKHVIHRLLSSPIEQKPGVHTCTYKRYPNMKNSKFSILVDNFA